MFTYQRKKRIFRHAEGEELLFPADCKLEFYMQPMQAFGMEAGGGQTLVYAKEAEFLFNANTGKHSVKSHAPLCPLEVLIDGADYKIELIGNVIHLTKHFFSLKEMSNFIDCLFYLLPTLLNVSYADPPYVDQVCGTVNGVAFRWECIDYMMHSMTTTQEKQEENFFRAFNNLFLIVEGTGRRRLAAGLHYFHVASRLERASALLGEFVAEKILNLAKTLEVLFPPNSKGVKSRDAIRIELGKIGFDQKQVESDFMPVIALRNQIDVAHVLLEVLSVDELDVIQRYAECAEVVFRKMFSRLLELITEGKYNVLPYREKSSSTEIKNVVRQMKNAIDENKISRSDNSFK